MYNGYFGSTSTHQCNVDITLPTAYSNQDYNGISEQLYFVSGQPPGSLSCINITIVDDSAAKGKETFTIVLTQPSLGVKISPSAAMAVVELTDSDSDPGGI